MENRNEPFWLLLAVFIVYLGIKYAVPGGRIALYPVTLFVTFLHEFGHAVGALLTGGGVEGIQINEDGSGYCITRGGNRAITLMGGYIGSALFGNALLFIGITQPKLARATLGLLSAAMIFTGIFWFNSLQTTALLLGFGASLGLLAYATKFSRLMLMFLGLASIAHIVEDFNVGPRSDLEMYAQLFHVIPATVWMYIWLVIVLLVCVANLRLILRR